MKHLVLFLVFPLFLNAQNYPSKPSNYITDEANVLNADEERALNSKLKSFEDSTSNQLFIYIASSLNGKDLTSYSQDIFHAWKIGQEGKNNGILISIFINDHKFRIHTGYGLEGVLPDIETKHIQDNDMRPLFKKNQYYEGIEKGIDQLMYYSKHEYNTEKQEEAGWEVFIFFYVFASIFLLITLLIAKGIKDRPKAKKTVVIISIILFLIPFLGAFFLIFMLFVALAMRKDLLKRSSSSSWSSSSESSWSSSDSSSSWSSSDSTSSSSDFSGGGGGDSGGGGSSSDW